MPLEGGLNPGNTLVVCDAQLLKGLFLPDVVMPELVEEPRAFPSSVLKLLAAAGALKPLPATVLTNLLGRSSQTGRTLFFQTMCLLFVSNLKQTPKFYKLPKTLFVLGNRMADCAEDILEERGEYSKEFLVSLDRSEADMKAGRVRTVTSSMNF